MTTTSDLGNYKLCGDTYFKHVLAKFSHIGSGDSIVFKDGSGNFAELYVDDGDNVVSLTDLTANDCEILDLLDLRFCTPSQTAIDHLAEIGFETDKLPDAKTI